MLNRLYQKADLECSTPYGIRGYCSWRRGLFKSDYLRVLNALRHQRLLQILPERIDETAVCVLNALRHQRLLQSTFAGPCSHVCSNPFVSRGTLSFLQPDNTWFSYNSSFLFDTNICNIPKQFKVDFAFIPFRRQW